MGAAWKIIFFLALRASIWPINKMGPQAPSLSSYCNCNIHHIIFCPINRRLISCRALGSLETSPDGTTVERGDGFTADRRIRLVFILRWGSLELSEWFLWLLKRRGTTASSSVLFYGGKGK